MSRKSLGFLFSCMLCLMTPPVWGVLDRPETSDLIVHPRPPHIQAKIDEGFGGLSSHSDSDWMYNGSAKPYLLLEVDERLFMQTTINNAPPEQKEFCVLDLGAGNFQWSQMMADFVNAQDFERDFTLTILGVRGEQYAGPEERQEGRCGIW